MEKEQYDTALNENLEYCNELAERINKISDQLNELKNRFENYIGWER